MHRGYNGVMCVEAGGPPAGTGCGGYVVGQTVKLLKQHHLLEDTDVVIFDVLGDVVCGGFAAPAPARRPRGDRHRQRLRLDLRDEPHHRGGAGQVQELQASASPAASPTARKDTDEVDRYCDVVGFRRIGHFPDLDAIRRSRLKKKTLFEMDPDEDIVAAQAEYMRLAAAALGRHRPARPRIAARPRDLRTPGVRLMADTYVDTRDRLEDYFDRTAVRAWERLTSDAPVSRIRQTVREGRDRMRALLLSRLPADLARPPRPRRRLRRRPDGRRPSPSAAPRSPPSTSRRASSPSPATAPPPHLAAPHRLRLRRHARPRARRLRPCRRDGQPDPLPPRPHRRRPRRPRVAHRHRHGLHRRPAHPAARGHALRRPDSSRAATAPPPSSPSRHPPLARALAAASAPA